MKKCLLLLLGLPAIASAGVSLCTSDEKIYFSCSTGKAGKIVSLCGDSELKKGNGYLQYRYGAIGKVELAYPPSRAGSLEKFRYAHYYRFQNDQRQISFSNDGFDYSVFTYYDGEGKKPIEEQGVLISNEKQPGKETRIVCRRPAIESLSRLEDVLSCDEENALASCK